MKDIKITIILPSLNVREYIEEALVSVVSQTLREIEILCIDAGSDDGTWDIIEDYAKEDDRIIPMHSSKKSYGHQVNLGIEASRGKYIAILETDDKAASDMYEKLYILAENNQVDYVKADYRAFFSQADGSYYYFDRHSFGERSFYDTVLEPIRHPEIGRDDWYLWQGIYRRDFLNEFEIRFSESPGAAYQDIGFLFLTGVFAKRAMYSSELLYDYRIDRETASSNTGKGLLFSYAEFYKLVEQGGNPILISEEAKRLLYTRMAKSFVSCYGGMALATEGYEHREAYKWFCVQLSQAIEHEIIDEDIIQSGRWGRLMALLDSEETYFSEFSLNEQTKDFIGSHEKIAIFGCGDYGYKAYKEVVSGGRTVVAFLDNNKSLWGKTLNGIKIYSPEMVKNTDIVVGILIANEAHYDDIRQQLIEYGIHSDRIGQYR